MTTERIYNTKDVDMIITIDTIIDAAIANKTFLQTKRSNWADPFFEDIKANIDTVTQNLLGFDSAIDLRESTQVVKSIQTKALADLSELKVQIEEDFKATPARKTEILNQLGFTSYYQEASRKKDQEALINLLYQYKTNLTPALKTEISDKGTAIATLDGIISHADTLKTANVTQEGNKGTRRVVTEADITTFNELYSKVISIARIAARFFKGNPAIQSQFSFSNVSKSLNNSKKAKPTTPQTT